MMLHFKRKAKHSKLKLNVTDITSSQCDVTKAYDNVTSAYKPTTSFANCCRQLSAVGTVQPKTLNFSSRNTTYCEHLLFILFTVKKH